MNITRQQQSPLHRRFLRNILLTFLGLFSAGFLAIGLLWVYITIVIHPRLPELNTITHYQPKIPLRIYSADQVLLGEFGVERRRFAKLENIPIYLKQAVIAIEDANFYQHSGINLMSIFRAILTNIKSAGSTGGGASTITQQVARNFFLSRNEASFLEKASRKFLYEIPLALKIEKTVSKDQILEIYMNQIYLGQRAFGFAAAAQIYFGCDIKDVTLAQAAMLAGLPKAPSAYNPVANLTRAQTRQQYILKRMLDLKYITQKQYEQALHEPLQVIGKREKLPDHAEFINEVVRKMLVNELQEDAYTRGLTVITTIYANEQEAAYQAVRQGVIAYDQRYKYRGPEGFITQLAPNEKVRSQHIFEALQNYLDNDDLLPAIVTKVSKNAVTAQLRNDVHIMITHEGLHFVKNHLTNKVKENQRIRPGAIIRVQQIPSTGKTKNTSTPHANTRWRIVQQPEVEAALIALDPRDGAIRALVGGFDFYQNHFNHVTQAKRQPGSAFKPFIYAAALEKGFGPATIVNDAPATYVAGPGQPNWEPKNEDGQFLGPISLRVGFQRSRNLVTIRILEAIGVSYAQAFISTRFGFDPKDIPPYLPLALGSGSTSPLQLANAYAVIANGGYRIKPYLIKEVRDAKGKIISQATPVISGENAPRTLDARNSYILNSLLQSAAQRGTGSASNQLNRQDIAGKTGTTNDAVDGWFAGYQKTLVAVAWMGYDKPRSLGKREFGSRLALPIWTHYMKYALKDVPEMPMEEPPGIVTIAGEPYFDHLVPEQGFIPTLGLDNSTQEQQEKERQEILDLFSGR